jgi:hypothetical protein
MENGPGQDGGGGEGKSRGSHAVDEASSLPADDIIDFIDDDGLDSIGDLGNGFDDPEGWMSERPHYWRNRPDIAHPTRASFLRHRIAELLLGFHRCGRFAAPPSPVECVDEAAWLRLTRDLFGHDSMGPDPLEDLGPDNGGGQ